MKKCFPPHLLLNYRECQEDIMKNIQEKPLVSIIVPVYNVEKYLDRCIKSILNQDYYNIELLLIDDGSTDKSGDICDKYTVDSRVKVIHKKNSGMSMARNTGLKYMTGEYVAFVDSDDYISNDYISHPLAKMVAMQKDIIIFDYCEIKNGRIYEPRYKKNNVIQKISTAENEYIYNLLIAEDIPNSMWNKLYKNKLWEKVKFPEGRTYEDFFVWTDILRNKINIGYLPETLYYYNRENPNSITSPLGILKTKSRFDLFLARKERLDLINSLNLSELIRGKMLLRCIDEAVEDFLINSGGNNLTYDEKLELMDFIRQERKNPLYRKIHIGTKRAILAWGIVHIPKIIGFFGRHRYKRKMNKLKLRTSEDSMR